MSRQKTLGKIFCIFLCINFIWSNCIFAIGFDYKLAAQSQIQDIILGAQFMYVGDKAFETAHINDIENINDLYRNIARLRADFMKAQGIPEEWKDKVMWLVFPDKDDLSKKSYYIFTPAGIYFRYTTSPSINDEFQLVLEKYAKSFGKPEQIKINGGEFYREKYEFAGENLQFIKSVLEELYGGIIESPKVFEKGEHVGRGVLEDKVKEYKKQEEREKIEIFKDIDIYPDYGDIIIYAISEMLGKKCLEAADVSNFIYNLLRDNNDVDYVATILSSLEGEKEDKTKKDEIRKILIESTEDKDAKIIGIISESLENKNPGEISVILYNLLKERIKVIISDNCFIYLSCYRKMRYSLLASVEGNIHITKALLDIFMDPSKFKDELKDYLGDELFNKLIGNRSDNEIGGWLKKCLAGAIIHEIYEFNVWMKDPYKYEKKAVHPIANNYEKKIAGESQFDRESAFDDISKFLILKHLGMKPDINLFNIMRDRQKDSRTKRTIGPDSEYGIYELIQLDEKGMKDKLDILFYEKPHKTDKGDRYYIVTYRNRAFAISKVDKDGIETIHSLYSDGTHIDWYPIENIIQDYKDLKAKIEQPQVVEYDHSMAEDRTRAGTKCAQLAWAGKKGIPTPLGFNIAKWANLAYLRNNPHLLEALQRIKELDVMDVTARKTFSERIKKLMMGNTNLPPYLMKELRRLVTVYSKRLGYDVNKGEYASFAYRGSGLMEDFEGNIPWFKKSIGAQPGQGTTALNAKGLDAISGAVIEAFAGLFNDQIFIYRDIQVFFEFVSKMKEEFGGGGEKEYKTLISALREAGYEGISKSLEDESSPGYVRLREALLVIESRDDLKNKYSSYNWLSKLNKAADDVLNPIKLLTGVAVLEQLDVYVSGTGFTSNLSNMRDGSTYARMQGKFPEGPGDDFSTYTRYERVNLGNGTGPGIVEGKFEPDKITGFSPDGNKWVIEDYEVGEKSMYMVYLDYGFNALKDVFSREKIVKIVDTYNILRKAQDGSTEKEQAIKDIKESLNIDRDDIGDWLRAMSDIWYYDGKPEFHKCPKTRKNDLLKKMKLTPRQFFILSYLIKHVLRIDTDYDKMTYLPSPNEMRERMVLKEEALQKLFQMIAQIGNLVSKEKCERGEDWHDRRDIEFAFAICRYDDPSPYKFKIERGEGIDLLTGKPNENPFWIKLCHLQNRAINPEKEVQDPHNLVFKQKKVDYDYVEEKGIKSIAEDGLAGFSAAKGIAYIVDPHKSLTIQEQEIRELVDNKEKIKEMLRKMGYKDIEIDKMVDEEFGVIPVLEEMGPEHDVIVQAANKAIVWRGNDTSHAYIFSLEQRIPICIGAKYRAGVESIRHGQPVVIDGSGGRIWPGDKGIPLLDDDLKIRIDMLPENTRAGVIVGDLKAAEQVTRLGAQSVLTRLEFVINQKIKIYPQAALAYDNLMKIKAIRMRKMKLEDEDLMKELDITEKELEDVKILEQNPEVIKEIKKTIKGFPTACTFMAEKMRYLANAFGAIFPAGNKMRDYDNKEKEALMYGLIGAKLYLKYDDNDPKYDSPLVGMRGSALMSNSHFEKCFRALRRGILRSIKDGYSNNSFFFVFLRTPRELKKELQDLENLCKEEGVFPKEIGVMIEVPSNVWIIDDILKELKEFQNRNPSIQEIFISFGTNDLTNLTGRTSREDKDFTGDLLVMDPILLDPEKGKIEIDKGVVFGPREKGKPWKIRINDEGAPVVLRSIEHVSSKAKQMNCIRSLCGQAITITMKRGMTKIARRIMSALDTFGTQTMNYVGAAMTDFDAKQAIMETTKEVREDAEKIATIFDVKETGAITGEVVFINNDKDVEKLRIKKKGKVTDKIVILRGKLSDIKTFESNLIPWDYLRYARAILVQDTLEDIGEIFNQDEVIKGRVKAKIGDLAEIKEGSIVTVDYNNSAVYKGKLRLAEVPVELNEITYEKGASVNTKELLGHNGADVFFSEKGIKIHPLAFILYADGSLDNGEFKKQIEALLEGKSKEDILKFQNEVLDGKEIDKYIEFLKGEVWSELGGLTKEDIDTFLEQIFYMQMISEAEKTGEKLCVHTIFRATRNQLKGLIGGRVIEMTKGKEGVNFDDADCRLQGGGRNISDFWRIHRAELRAFKDAKEKCPNLRLQLTTMGTRSREVLELQLKVLEDLGIDRDREEIGLRIVTPADILYIEDYIRQGIKFFTYERYELAEGLLSSNFNHPLLFPGDELEKEVKFILERPLEYIKYIIAKTDKSVWLSELPQEVPVGKIESHLLPLYLYELAKIKLNYNDEQMAKISYTDKDGGIHINRAAAYVIGIVLNRELNRGVDTGTPEGKTAVTNGVVEVLKAHEDIERLIINLGIDFTDLERGLIDYLNVVKDDWSDGFKNIVGEGNGEERLVNLLSAFLNNYPAYLFKTQSQDLSKKAGPTILKELAVHQVIEKRFFNQPVRLLQSGYKDAKKDRIDLPNSLIDLLIEYVEFLEALERIQNFNGRIILDIGCGEGGRTDGIASKNPDALVVGVDIDKNRINEVRIKRKKENIVFLRMDATKLPFKENTFSEIYFFYPDPTNEYDEMEWDEQRYFKPILNEAFRLAKPGARFYCETESTLNARIIVDCLKGLIGSFNDNTYRYNKTKGYLSVISSNIEFNARPNPLGVGAESVVIKYIKGVFKPEEKDLSYKGVGVRSQVPLAKKAKKGDEVYIWEAEIKDGNLVKSRVLNEELFSTAFNLNIANLIKKIDYIKEEMGAGIAGGIDIIRIVDNIRPTGKEKVGDLVPYSMIKEENEKRVLLLDKDAFKDENRLYIVLMHGFREGLLIMVEPKDDSLRELTSIYLSVKDAIRKGITDVGDVSDLDLDNQFLKVVELIKGKTDEEIIAVIIEFMRSMEYYKEFFSGPMEFNFSGDWEREMLAEIEKGIDRYQAALNVFNRIAEAKGIVSKVKIQEEKMIEGQMRKGGIEREGLRDIYKAFGELIDWYSKSTSELFFVDAKWQGIAARRFNGEVVSNIELNEKYQSLWQLFKSKGINSIAISNKAFNKLKDSANRFINIIDDILVNVSETDFIGYAVINELTVKVTKDAGGKRVIIDVKPKGISERLLNWFLNEGLNRFREIRENMKGKIAEWAKENTVTNAIKVDIDLLTEDNVREIKEITGKHSNVFRFYYFSSSGMKVDKYLKDKGLKQDDLSGINLNNMITLIDPARLKAIDIEKRTDLISRYYLPVQYIDGSVYMAAGVVLAKGDIGKLRETGILTTIISLYEQFGLKLTEEDVIKILGNPWEYLLPKVEAALEYLDVPERVINMANMAA